MAGDTINKGSNCIVPVIVRSANSSNGDDAFGILFYLEQYMRKVRFTNTSFSNGHKEGWFHQWMMYMPEEGDGTTVAICELPDGSIVELNHVFVQFAHPGDDAK